jgi:hypothetical protein
VPSPKSATRPSRPPFCPNTRISVQPKPAANPAPPVYRPTPPREALQARTHPAPPRISPAVPPRFGPRPGRPVSLVAQSKITRPALETRPAPPVYRPNIGLAAPGKEIPRTKWNRAAPVQMMEHRQSGVTPASLSAHNPQWAARVGQARDLHEPEERKSRLKQALEDLGVGETRNDNKMKDRPLGDDLRYHVHANGIHENVLNTITLTIFQDEGGPKQHVNGNRTTQGEWTFHSDRGPFVEAEKAENMLKHIVGKIEEKLK